MKKKKKQSLPFVKTSFFRMFWMLSNNLKCSWMFWSTPKALACYKSSQMLLRLLNVLEYSEKFYVFWTIFEIFWYLECSDRFCSFHIFLKSLKNIVELFEYGRIFSSNFCYVKLLWSMNGKQVIVILWVLLYFIAIKIVECSVFCAHIIFFISH